MAKKQKTGAAQPALFDAATDGSAPTGHPLEKHLTALLRKVLANEPHLSATQVTDEMLRATLGMGAYQWPKHLQSLSLDVRRPATQEKEKEERR